ncbi:MAG TPA: ATP synthase F0 subunit B [Blastocatellia bacterium]|nr:ATP synthase F0 subunit B [Blastocatellia bacterium]
MIFDCLLQPVLLLATDGTGEGGLLSNLTFWRVVNLLVFVLILVYILRNKIRIGQVFDDRRAAIRKELEQARHDKQEAERRLAEVEARLARLDQDVAEIRAEAELEVQREAERIRKAAAADAEKIKQMAQREIEGAMKSARSELRAFVAEHSVEMAESIIRREIRPDDDRRMLDEYLDNLREVNR